MPFFKMPMDVGVFTADGDTAIQKIFVDEQGELFELTVSSEPVAVMLDPMNWLLKRTQIIDQSLSNFSGLFGQAAKTWMDTIQNWSKDPGTYKKGELYTEQINLDDEQVVSVHL